MTIAQVRNFGMCASFLVALHAFAHGPTTGSRYLRPNEDSRLKHLVDTLGDESFTARNDAEKELSEFGMSAQRDLRKGMLSEDFEIKERATRLFTPLLREEPSLIACLLADRLISELNAQNAAKDFEETATRLRNGVSRDQLAEIRKRAVETFDLHGRAKNETSLEVFRDAAGRRFRAALRGAGLEIDIRAQGKGAELRNSGDSFSYVVKSNQGARYRVTWDNVASRDSATAKFARIPTFRLENLNETAFTQSDTNVKVKLNLNSASTLFDEDTSGNRLTRKRLDTTIDMIVTTIGETNQGHGLDVRGAIRTYLQYAEPPNGADPRFVDDVLARAENFCPREIRGSFVR